MLAPFEAAGIRPNVVAKIEDAESLLFMLSANANGRYDLTVVSVRPFPASWKIACGTVGATGRFYCNEGAVWTPDDQNPSLSKILPLLN